MLLQCVHALQVKDLTMPTQVEQRLQERMFVKMLELFDKRYKDPLRNSMLDYAQTLAALLHTLTHLGEFPTAHEWVKHIELLRSDDRRRKHNVTIKAIFHELGWLFPLE